jgi:D-lactate dehydrogenase
VGTKSVESRTSPTFSTLHPELTVSATRRAEPLVAERGFSAYTSTNRTCEFGMTRATAHLCRYLLEVLGQVTR